MLLIRNIELSIWSFSQKYFITVQMKYLKTCKNSEERNFRQPIKTIETSLKSVLTIEKM